MSGLLAEFGAKALRLGIPLAVQMDLTWRCNERCVHCYLDHEDRGELRTDEVLRVLGELADAGVFFLTLSGGEIFMRRDLFEIIEHARELSFSVKLKTNAVMIRQAQAERLRALDVHGVQVSVYSHDAQVHDAITKRAGSFERTIRGIGHLRAAGVPVTIATSLMRQNAQDWPHVQSLAQRMGAGFQLDPTITPALDGAREPLALNVDTATLRQVLHDERVVGDPDAFCEPPAGPPESADAWQTLPCSAGHTACYISPYGDVFPCVQFPLACGNVRQAPFEAIWRESPQLREVRSITLADLHSCSSCVHGGSCSRCPGLAYMAGDMRGPSLQDCEKSFARTGAASEPWSRGRDRQTADSPPRRVTWIASR